MRNSGYLSRRKEQIEAVAHRTTREAVDLCVWFTATESARERGNDDE